MIDTNQMKFSFDHEAIARDFVIFEARRDSGNYDKSKVPDVALQECRALAVAYDWGNSCYILYQRASAEKISLKRTLEGYESDVQVREIASSQLAEKQSFRLAQLLCNAIPSLGSGCKMFHNVTGKLYYSGYHGKSLNRTLAHACRIRKVISTGSILQFERYLPLLEVDFVRASAWTVVPFPFKYLREWAKNK